MRGTPWGATDDRESGSEPPGRARGRSTPGDWTGRYLVLLRDDDGGAAYPTLHTIAGSPELGRLEEFAAGGSGGGRSLDSEAIWFRRLGIAVVPSDPRVARELDARRAQPAGSILAVEPERFVQASGFANEGSPWAAAWAEARYLKGYHDAVEQLCGFWDSRGFRGPTRGVSRRPEAFGDESCLTWGLQAIGAGASPYLGRGIRLCVLDTGLASGHPDFEGRDIRMRSFVSCQGAEDRNGHGTHCAGVAAGSLRPVRGPRYGVAPGAELCIGKVLDDHGDGVDASVLAGIEWAVALGCRVVSLSLGSPARPGERYSLVYEMAARRALAAGTLLIAAAGNQSDRPGRIAAVGRPANSPSIMAVGAVTRSLGLASFSNGRAHADDEEVDLVAPGAAVCSSWPPPLLTHRLTGTSMAAPHVAGLAALWSEATETCGWQLWRRLAESCLELADPRGDAGAGLPRAPRV